MDGGALGTDRNFAIFKEPRGFIKLIQFLFAILAFATTCGFSTNQTISVLCSNNTLKTATFTISYPFVLEHDSMIKVPVCASVQNDTANIYGSWQANSQFFVFVGVMVMLYCLAAMIVYVFINELYRRNHTVPKADFLVTLSISIAWLFSSSIWAHGVNMVKSEVFRYDFRVPECAVHSKCTISDSATYGGLNVSLIFGFANSLLWASNLWFLYKETAWYQNNNQQQYNYNENRDPKDLTDVGRI